MTRVATVLALGLVLAVGASSAEAAKPDRAAKRAAKADRAGKGKKANAVAGTVLKVENNMITIQGRGKNAAESLVQTDDKTKFEGVASIADVKPGMRVIVTPSTGTAEKVVVRPDGLGGKGARKLKNK